MGEERKVYKVLVEKPEGKSTLGRPRHITVVPKIDEVTEEWRKLYGPNEKFTVYLILIKWLNQESWYSTEGKNKVLNFEWKTSRKRPL
jgi:hypothetical protein